LHPSFIDKSSSIYSPFERRSQALNVLRALIFQVLVRSGNPTTTTRHSTSHEVPLVLADGTCAGPRLTFSYTRCLLDLQGFDRRYQSQLCPNMALQTLLHSSRPGLLSVRHTILVHGGRHSAHNVPTAIPQSPHHTPLRILTMPSDLRKGLVKLLNLRAHTQSTQEPHVRFSRPHTANSTTSTEQQENRKQPSTVAPPKLCATSGTSIGTTWVMPPRTECCRTPPPTSSPTA